LHKPSIEIFDNVFVGVSDGVSEMVVVGIVVGEGVVVGISVGVLEAIGICVRVTVCVGEDTVLHAASKAHVTRQMIIYLFIVNPKNPIITINIKKQIPLYNGF